MKTSNKGNNPKVTLNLPTQSVWKELQEYGIGASIDKRAKSPKKLEHLLDQAFDLLLDRLIRQT